MKGIDDDIPFLSFLEEELGVATSGRYPG